MVKPALMSRLQSSWLKSRSSLRLNILIGSRTPAVERISIAHANQFNKKFFDWLI